MNNDDERDYAEEAANRREMQQADCDDCSCCYGYQCATGTCTGCPCVED